MEAEGWSKKNVREVNESEYFIAVGIQLVDLGSKFYYDASLMAGERLQRVRKNSIDGGNGSSS